jgi:hypothetical protein
VIRVKSGNSCRRKLSWKSDASYQTPNKKENNMKLCKKYLVLGLLGSVLVSGGAYAASTSVTANMAFDSALSLSGLTNINFGTVQAGIVNATYTIAAATGVVTPGNGGVVISNVGQSAGQLTIAGSTTQTIAISTGGYIASNGVTLSAAMCAYNGGTATACDGTGLTGQTAAGAGKTLKLGVTATDAGTAAANSTATPSFTVTVVYG